MNNVLVREKREPCELHDPTMDQAAEVLDYRCGKCATEVQEALVRIGVQPFTQASVDAYKRKVRRKVEGRDDGYMWTFFFSLLFAAAAFICGIVTAFAPDAGAAVAVWFFFAACCLVLIAFAAAAIGMSRMQEIEWVGRRIAEYRKPIPEFALATAIALKKACPSVELFIEEGQVKDREPDPFLYATVIGYEFRYYLEVWNEPGFGKERDVDTKHVRGLVD